MIFFIFQSRPLNSSSLTQNRNFGKDFQKLFSFWVIICKKVIFSRRKWQKFAKKWRKFHKKKFFFSFFTRKSLKEKSIFLEMQQEVPTKPYWFLKLHPKLRLKSLPKHDSACGILQKTTHKHCRTVPSTTKVASTNKLFLQF